MKHAIKISLIYKPDQVPHQTHFEDCTNVDQTDTHLEEHVSTLVKISIRNQFQKSHYIPVQKRPVDHVKIVHQFEKIKKGEEALMLYFLFTSSEMH